MKQIPRFFILVAALWAINAQAAMEYLRFEGSIDKYYENDGFHPGYNSALGFHKGQAVYFDFLIDTSLNPSGYQDTDFGDYFSTTYLGGTIAGPTITRGETISFPEGDTTWLFVTSSLRVGSVDWQFFDGSGYPIIRDIDTWNIGDNLALLSNGYTDEYSIGNVTLTHRSYSPPPAYVPVPASLWLFCTGLSLFALNGRKRSNKL